ncbi:MAG: 30S ribosomal protein S8 [Candidatus Marsarchaeota archaeon]|nr:30S ribosomal protein S8 [Candidatus Marsarchaeota archaeon]
MADTLAEALNKIKTLERIGRSECTMPSTKLTRAVLSIMQREGYLGSVEEVQAEGRKVLSVKLANKINDIGVVKPRYPVQKGEVLKYEAMYIPSKSFGMLIFSTSEGLLTNREIKEKGIGGRLIAYVY